MQKSALHSAVDTSATADEISGDAVSRYLPSSRGGTRTRDPGIMRNARPREPRNRARTATANSDDDDSSATNGVVPPVRPDVCYVEQSSVGQKISASLKRFHAKRRKLARQVRLSMARAALRRGSPVCVVHRGDGK